MESKSSRATYISKTTQNQLIIICGNQILNQILEQVKLTKYYSIIFDETTDLGHRSQMSLCVRYFDKNFKIREDFVAFLDCYNELEDTSINNENKLTGLNIAKIVLSFFKKIQFCFR